MLMKGGAHPSLVLPYPSVIRKKYPFTAGLTEFFCRRRAKPSLELTTLRRLPAPQPLRTTVPVLVNGG